jgi:hypothetical protein
MSDLAPLLQGFFTDRMITQKHASEHTIRSYRVPRTWLSAVSTQGAVSHASGGFVLAVTVCGAA